MSGGKSSVRNLKARILIQDDKEGIREIIGVMLTSEGYQCDLVETPSQALRHLRARGADLVLCGIFEWSEKSLLRMLNRYPDVPVIVLTAVHDLSVPLRCLRMGCYDFLLKPFEREQLFYAVRRALEYRRLKFENRKYRRMLGRRTRNR